jgi:hypothetical protein
LVAGVAGAVPAAGGWLPGWVAGCAGCVAGGVVSVPGGLGGGCGLATGGCAQAPAAAAVTHSAVATDTKTAWNRRFSTILAL